MVVGETTLSSSAPAIVTILNVEPGSYASVTARLRRASGEARRELVRVERRVVRHREDRAGPRIHHDRRRATGAELPHGAREDLLGVRLDLVVDRQVTLRPGRSALRGDDVDRPAERVLDDRLEAGPAGERLVERALEPVEAVVVGAREAEHVRGDGSLRVGAQLLRVEAEARESPAC